MIQKRLSPSSASRKARNAGLGGPRTVIVGDVHGCRSELERLLDVVSFRPEDRLVFVGDLVARGPDSLGVLALARTTGAVVVRGNHEERVLREGRPKTRKPTPDAGSSHAVHREIADTLGADDWALLEGTPLYHPLPAHGLTVVHAGIDPELPLAAQSPDVLLYVRHARTKAGKKKLWGEIYEGPLPFVFGHNAVEKLQLHPFATGLDTGCVYGGELTALVLSEGEALPRDPEERRKKLVSVPAEKVYFAF